ASRGSCGGGGVEPALRGNGQACLPRSAFALLSRRADLQGRSGRPSLTRHRQERFESKSPRRGYETRAFGHRRGRAFLCAAVACDHRSLHGARREGAGGRSPGGGHRHRVAHRSPRFRGQQPDPDRRRVGLRRHDVDRHRDGDEPIAAVRSRGHAVRHDGRAGKRDEHAGREHVEPARPRREPQPGADRRPPRHARQRARRRQHQLDPVRRDCPRRDDYRRRVVGLRCGCDGAIERYRYLINLPNYGRGAFFQGNTFSAARIAGGTLRCETGLPIAEKFTPSQDCVDAIVADLQSTAEMEQTIAEYNLQGRFADLPAGEARFAAGVSYRENSYFYNSDPLASQTSFLDGAVGIFPGGNSRGETSVREIYGELLLPAVSNKRFVDELTFELGYRYSDNDPSDSVETYKLLFDWRVNDRLRLRGGRNVANRAPNIGELFEARTQVVGAGSSVLGDLCNPGNT